MYIYACISTYIDYINEFYTLTSTSLAKIIELVYKHITTGRGGPPYIPFFVYLWASLFFLLP